MAWTRTMSERALEREFLEADAVRMIWELNYRLLMESSLTGHVLQVEQITAACQAGEQSKVQNKGRSMGQSKQRNKEQKKGGIRLWQLLNNLRDWIWGS